ncbi:YceI family protein [Hymenobacter sp. BT175]|uniref:YceI family protein n=1 Tax=Hymenobacter translucens TaxID=2886507 RepID=UPI001D0F0E14|nr:YceI family protein [Hymenobacter translucens]MCC2546815.1 YceI family protein [Hymenobacter translucens]
MKQLFLFASLLLLVVPASAQARYSTRSGLITFFSATPVEDIEARNTQVAALLDLSSGQVAFTVPMKSFVFKRSLMQEHFNENYVESEKYPRASFAGKVVNFSPALLTAAGPQSVQVEGDLTIHGVKRRVKVPGTLELKNNQLLVQARFGVAPADYNIEIPALVRDNIAKTVDVTVNLSCSPVPAKTTAP